MLKLYGLNVDGELAGLPAVVPVAARRTVRLTAARQTLAFALGGEAGARVSHRFHMPVSADTLLRVVRGTAYPALPTPRVLGVDDFALRKGCVYGTMLVDLERQRPVDLLPDRTATTLRDWLIQHPGVEIIARDRSSEYARGATVGAPTALQVADRWHMLHNLREALERVLHRRHATLTRLPTPDPQPALGDVCAQNVGLHTTLRIPSASERTVSDMARERRLVQYQTVRALHAQGLNILQIARRLRINRITVRKYVRAAVFPERSLPSPAPSMLDPYRAYLHQRWVDGCHNAAQRWREVQTAGYGGTRKQVEKWAYHRRLDAAPSTPQMYRHGRAARGRGALPTLATPRRLVWDLLRHPRALTPADLVTLARIQQDREIAVSDDLAQQFLVMVRQRAPELLDAWLASSATSNVAPSCKPLPLVCTTTTTACGRRYKNHGAPVPLKGTSTASNSLKGRCLAVRS